MTIEAYGSAYSMSIFGSYRLATKEKKSMNGKGKEKNECAQVILQEIHPGPRPIRNTS
jgi:hypothetical protein